MNEPDGNLSDHLADGCPRAWSALYREHARRMWMYVQRRVRNPHVADDLVSTIFTAAYASHGRYDASQSPDRWLYGIARRKLADHLRQVYRQQRRGFGLTALPAADALAARPDGVAAMDARARAVDAALDALPANQRDVLVWMHYDRLSVRQIAQRLGRSEKAAENLLYRARIRFRETYQNPDEEGAELRAQESSR